MLFIASTRLSIERRIVFLPERGIAGGVYINELGFSDRLFLFASKFDHSSPSTVHVVLQGH